MACSFFSTNTIRDAKHSTKVPLCWISPSTNLLQVKHQQNNEKICTSVKTAILKDFDVPVVKLLFSFAPREKVAIDDLSLDTFWHYSFPETVEPDARKLDKHFGSMLRNPKKPLITATCLWKVDVFLQTVRRMIHHSQNMTHLGSPSMETDFLKIRKECLAKGVLFEDPEFPPEKANLYYHQPPSDVEFQWKRPKELTPSPQFVIDDLRKFDLHPGSYGQPWLISALRVLIEYRALFYRAVPADQGFTPSYQYAGIFHFRFWFGGQWVEVLVDDRLPVVNGKLAFVQSQNSDQYWAALLEKAYAKLHGSFEALAYTTGPDIFSELSGGATESLLLDPPIPHLPHFIARTLRLTVIPTAIVDKKNSVGNGIVPGVHYGILGIDAVGVGEKSELQLVKLKLPPSVQPFSGPWASPENIEWRRVSPKDRARLDVDKEAAKGAFWMSLREFEETFSRLDLVHLDKETCNTEEKFLRLNARPPQMRSFQGSWRKGSTAGGSRNNPDSFHINPQLMLRVDEPGDVVLALLQHNHQEPKVIGFSVYKVVKRVGVEHGNFVVVPTTYDVGQEATFTLRAYSEKPIYLWVLDNAPVVAKQPVVKSPQTLDKSYEDMFLSFADQNKTVNCYELQELLHTCLPNGFELSADNFQLLMLRYMRRDGTLRFGDFVASILHLITIFHIANRFSVTKKGGFTTTEWMRIALRC